MQTPRYGPVVPDPFLPAPRPADGAGLWFTGATGGSDAAPRQRSQAQLPPALGPQTPITGVRDMVAPRFGGLGLGRYGLDRSDGRLV
jgi:hypothetical protein